MNYTQHLRMCVKHGRIARRAGHSLREAAGNGITKGERHAIEQGWLQADAELRAPNVFKLARFKQAKASHQWLANARHIATVHDADGFCRIGYR